MVAWRRVSVDRIALSPQRRARDVHAKLALRHEVGHGPQGFRHVEPRGILEYAVSLPAKHDQPACLVRDPSHGLLRGRGSNSLLLQDVDARWEVPVGAQLTTSGIELSPEIRSAFPRGLAIGRVAAVNGTGSSIVQSADVEPILALDSARTLLVITNYRGGLPAPSVAP